jgi:peptide-methionine (S)-S-oxide reductase
MEKKMTIHLQKLISLVVFGVSLQFSTPATYGAAKTDLPSPLVDENTSITGPQTAVLAGGCFWGVQGVFQHVKGVIKATSGYAGGTANTAEYETVSTGRTGHAESVKIEFDPSKISYGQLLKIYFAVAHNPTQLNRQGPDEGTQYRSAIFFSNEDQQRIANAYIKQLQSVRVFNQPIVTQVGPLQKFYPAEAYHQDYLKNHPNNPYIVMHDMPKLNQLKVQFPELYIDK